MPNPHPRATRHSYSDAQLQTYLSALPSAQCLILSDMRAQVTQDPLATLRRLQLLTMRLVPFGSVAMHYSTHHTISLDADALFEKLVMRRHGGYCMENNAFWATVLRGLGYRAIVVGGRVSVAEGGTRGLAGQGFQGWGHEVVLLDLGALGRWLSDIGFGGRASCEPLKLEVGAVARGAPGVVQRIDRRPIADWIEIEGGEGRKMWVVDVLDDKFGAGEGNGIAMNGVSSDEARQLEAVSAEQGWRPAYCFADTEWLPQDFEIINYRMCRDRKSLFVKNLIMTRPILDEAGEKCVGQVSLVKEEVSRTRLGDDGKSVEKILLVKCESEADRIRALEEYFDVALRADEVRGIRGLPSEIL
jgi:arylamine N-acetyltransferase